MEFKSSHPSHRQPNRANQPAKASQQKPGPASLTNKKERKKRAKPAAMAKQRAEQASFRAWGYLAQVPPRLY